MQELAQRIEELERSSAEVGHKHSEKDVVDLDRMRYRGLYTKDEAYEVNDVVIFKDKLYICVVAHKEIAPSNDEYWEYFALREVPVRVVGGIGGGSSKSAEVTDHALLINLDYAASGHSGFLPDTHLTDFNHALIATALQSEADPVYLADKPNIVFDGDNISRLVNDEGYLKSFTETDPVFGASPAAGIGILDIASWNAAYGWGDHASEGYLTFESDPLSLHLDQVTPQTIINGIPLLESIRIINANNQLVDKLYVDLATSSLRLTEFFTSASSDVADYYDMCLETSAEDTLTSGLFDYSVDPTEIFKFITCVGEPHLTKLVAGTYSARVYIYKTGNKLARVYFELWHMDEDGVEIAKLGTSNITDWIDEAPAVSKNVQVILDNDVTLVLTDRIAVKWFAYTETGGQNITVSIEIDGTQDSNFGINVNPLELSNIFVPYKGALYNVDLGEKTITAANLNISNWDTAYGWGNHAGLYSLLSHLHTGVYEPLFGFSTYLDQVVKTTSSPTFTNLTIGNNGDVDYTLTFDGATSNGVLTWLEDEKTLKLGSTGSGLWLDGTTGDTPTSGAGTRLMWIPSKIAFRSGRALGTEWDNANIGTGSVALGNNLKASGVGSICMGYADSDSGSIMQATNTGSIAMGYVTTNQEKAIMQSTGLSSFAGGFVRAGEQDSTMTSSGKGSFAWGYIESDVQSIPSTLTVSGDGAVGFAYLNNYNDSSVFSNTGTGAFGGGYLYSDASPSTMSIAGKGAFGWGYVADGATFTVNGDGAVGLGTSSGVLTAVGAGAISIGTSNQVDNDYSTGLGTGNNIDGFYSVGIGKDNAVTANYGIAVGNTNIVSGNAATAVGYGLVASGQSSLALGYGTTGTLTVAAGQSSAAIGHDVKAFKEESFTFGADVTNNITQSMRLGIGGPDLEIKPNRINSYGDLFVADKSDTGAELILNGTFTGSATSWTLGTGWTYSGNTARALNPTGTLSQTVPITIEVGKTYYAQWEIPLCFVGNVVVTIGGQSYTCSHATLYKEIFTATDTNSIVFTPSANAWIHIDNVSVKEITGGDLKVLGNTNLAGTSNIIVIPTVDPVVAGAIWNDSGTLKISAG